MYSSKRALQVSCRDSVEPQTAAGTCMLKSGNVNAKSRIVRRSRCCYCQVKGVVQGMQFTHLSMPHRKAKPNRNTGTVDLHIV